MRAVLYFVPFLVLSDAYSDSDVLKRIYPLYGISNLANGTNNNMCYEQLQFLSESIVDGKVWAIKALDASGTPDSGFVYGNNLWIGSHYQCKDISNTKPLEVNNEKIKQLITPFDFPPFPMEFAVIYLQHNSTLQRHTQVPLEWIIQLGLCIPKSCSKEEISVLAEQYFDGNNLEVQQVFNISMKVIEVRKLAENVLWIFMLPKTIILSLIIVIIIFLSIAGTISDVRNRNLQKNMFTRPDVSDKTKSINITTVEMASKTTCDEFPTQNILSEILHCFSLFSNSINLTNIKLSGDAIGCIHGLRFLGMLWVIAVHAIFYQIDYLKNVPHVLRLSEDFMTQILSNSTYCVDSYLFLSGFLVSYLYYKTKNPHEQSDKPINFLAKSKEFLMKTINRFLRLTPSYMVVLMFTNVMYTLYRKNSSLISSERADITCDKFWWRNILYINNLYPRKEMCMSWSWYLSLDTQFFTITMFLLILSTIVFKISAAVVFLLLLVTIVGTAYKSYSIGYIPTLDEQLVQLDAIYDLPWNRIGPYLIGVITAYILKIRLQNKLVLRKTTLMFLWTIFPMINLWILFTLYTRDLSIEFSAVYVGISRTLWGVGLAWLLIACCTGNAKLLNRFLSFRGFIPLSRLTYCAYLLNPVMANIIYLGMELPLESSLTQFAITICGLTMGSFFMAYILSVLFESPFILLTKMALRKLKVSSPQSSSSPNSRD